MEGQGKKIISALLALLVFTGLSAQNRSEQRDSLVRLIKAKSLELIEKHGTNYRKTISATFFHNNTYFICDTALWNVDSKVINAWGNVRVVQEGTILTSDKMDYLIDEDLIQARGTLVQLEDKDHNTLRTHYLDYNTKDSLAFFTRGGAMKDKDGQIIESVEGSYDAKKSFFQFKGNVNMYTDSIFIKSNRIDYESGPSRAVFPEKIDFWKDDNMLSADRGWYERLEETFFFNGFVHATSKEQEAWCDSLYYYRVPNNILMLNKVQVQDTTRNAFALANELFYEDSLKQVTLRKEAAVALRTEDKVMGADSVQRTKIDTIYIGADKLIYYTLRKCDIPEEVTKASEERLTEIHSDPVTEYRRKALVAAQEAARKAAEENADSNPLLAGRKPAGPGSVGPAGSAAGGGKAPSAAENALSGDSPASPEDSTATSALPGDLPDSDSLRVQLDSAALAQMAFADSLAKARADSIAIADSLANLPPPDTSRVGFALGVGNVKIFRKDIQVACDSMRFNELDSIARFYVNPIVWNDGNRQYTADSIGVLVNSAGIDRASLMSNAFIITQETPVLYDQIRATEVMAYFDTTAALRRFDALGGANALFFLKEKEEYATVNKVDCKMLSAWFQDGELQTIHYFDSPKNDAYPLPQMAESDKRMKGFNWQEDLKPQGKEDITDLAVRTSQREEYAAHPKTVFKQTDIYFPGYMKKVYAAIEASRLKARQRAAAKDADESGSADSGAETSGDGEETPSSAENAPETDSDSTLVSATENTVKPGSTVAPGDSTIIETVLSDSGTFSVEEADSTVSPVSKKIVSKKELREKAYQERLAAREARWAAADSVDAAKAAVKAQKKLERQKAREERLERKRLKQDEVDAKKLEKYIERYSKKYKKQKEREARRNKLKHDKDGIDPGKISEVREDRHPEQRGIGEPTLDPEAAEPAETPVQGTE